MVPVSSVFARFTKNRNLTWPKKAIYSYSILSTILIQSFPKDAISYSIRVDLSSTKWSKQCGRCNFLMGNMTEKSRRNKFASVKSTFLRSLRCRVYLESRCAPCIGKINYNGCTSCGINSKFFITNAPQYVVFSFEHNCNLFPSF